MHIIIRRCTTQICSKFQILWPFLACSRGDFSLSVPVSFLAWGCSGQSLRRLTVRIEAGLIEGRSGDMFSGGNWLRDFAHINVRKGQWVGVVLRVWDQNNYDRTLPK